MQKINIKRGVIAGNFDVIHPGYIAMFEECKKHCDRLIVCLHEDPSIERPEKLKPILHWSDRVKILSSLRQVDYVFPYQTEEDLYEALIKGNFDVRFLGDDYIRKENMDSKLKSIYCAKHFNIKIYKILVNKLFAYILVFVHIGHWF